MFRLFYSITLSFLISSTVFATVSKNINEPQIKIQTTATSQIYWTLYSDMGVTKIDVIEERNNEPQQVVQSWGFSDFQQAKSFYESKTHRLPLLTAQLWNSETQNLKTQVNKKLWEAKNTWSWDWELKYASWVSENVDKTFMQKYQIPSDCADLAYILRWIFARNNSLPMASKLSSTGKLMTHETVLKEWEKLSTDPEWSKDKLFRAALRYLTRQTYTHTLMKDSYPIAINPESFTEGVHHLGLHERTGHTMLVYKVDRTGGVPARVLYSNMPIEIRELYESPFSDISWPVENERAFLRFRWPVKSASGWSLLSGRKMPFYSLEQFSPEIQKEGPSFFVAAFKRISPNFDPLRLVEETINSIFSQLENRVKVVAEGFQYCQTNDCKPGTPGDADWSTPSRDRRLRETYQALSQTIGLYREMTDEINIPEAQLALINNYNLVIQGKNYNFLIIYLSAMLELMDSDPQVSIEERWSLTSESMGIRAEKKLEALFFDRDSKLKTLGQCTLLECPLGSKAWFDKSTVVEDLEISSMFNRIRIVCGAIKETCSEFNQIFNKSDHLKTLFSKAVTQHASPSSSLQQRQGFADMRIQFVPESGSVVKLSENIFYQSGSIFRLSPEDVFPDILCTEASINVKDGTTTAVCLTRTDDTIYFDFLDSKLQPFQRIEVPNGNKLLMSSYWLSQSDIYILVFVDHLKIYSARGQFLGEVIFPEKHKFVGKKWLVTLDQDNASKYLDLSDIQKGWVKHQLAAVEDIENIQSFTIGNNGFFLHLDSFGIHVTNALGEKTFSTEENYFQHHHRGQYLMTTILDEKFKIYKLYQFENGAYKFVTEFKALIDQINWIIYQNESGYIYGDKAEGYSIYSFHNQRHSFLEWTKNRTLSQIDDDSIVTIQENPRLYVLNDLQGRELLNNQYLSVQTDDKTGLKRINYFVNKIFYNQTHRPGSMDSPLFSSPGFFYSTQSEESNFEEDLQLRQSPNTFVFGLSNASVAMHLLARLNVDIKYYSVMSTSPRPLD